MFYDLVRPGYGLTWFFGVSRHFWRPITDALFGTGWEHVYEATDLGDPVL